MSSTAILLTIHFCVIYGNDKDKVWNKAKLIKGEDATRYRQDPYGNVLYYNSYGKNTEMGWDIDHIHPKSRGGSDNLRNLQALKASINKSKGNSMKKRSRHNY